MAGIEPTDHGAKNENKKRRRERWAHTRLRAVPTGMQSPSTAAGSVPAGGLKP